MSALAEEVQAADADIDAYVMDEQSNSQIFLQVAQSTATIVGCPMKTLPSFHDLLRYCCQNKILLCLRHHFRPVSHSVERFGTCVGV